MGVVASALGAASQVGPGIIQGIPGKTERQFNRDIRSDRERLADGAGGMSSAERNAMQAQALQQVYAQRRQASEDLARASSSDYSSGLQQQRLAGLEAGTASAGQQGLSNVRAQDLAVGAQQRQDLYGRMAQSIANTQNRRNAMATSLQGDVAQSAIPTLTGQAGTAGANATAPTAAQIQAAAKTMQKTGSSNTISQI